MQNNLFKAAQLSDDPFLLQSVIGTHVKMRHDAGIRLREKLTERRERRAKERREINLNAALSNNYLNLMRSKVGTIVSGNASDAMSWKKISDYGDVDRRTKQFESTDNCVVVDVTAWARGTALPDITQRLTATQPSRPGTQSLSAKKRLEKALLGSNFRSSRLSHQLPQMFNTKLTQHAIAQAEADYSLLGCGATHIPREEFEGRSLDFSVDCGPRRIFYFQFLDQIKNHSSDDHLNFEGFLKLVFPECSHQEIRVAVLRWGRTFDWTLGLNVTNARYIERLWKRAEKSFPLSNSFDFHTPMRDTPPGALEDKDQLVSFDSLMKLLGNVNVSNDGLRQQFNTADNDHDGYLSKREFARLLSGELNQPITGVGSGDSPYSSFRGGAQQQLHATSSQKNSFLKSPSLTATKGVVPKGSYGPHPPSMPNSARF